MTTEYAETGRLQPDFDCGVELSAPCRGVVVWALLEEIGVDGAASE